MSYDEWHTEEHCDKCGGVAGKENLFKLPFAYKDANDGVHEDLGDGYRQYFVCLSCWKGGKYDEKF